VSNSANPQDLNRYAYVRNNPLLYTDPTGHEGFTRYGWADDSGSGRRRSYWFALSCYYATRETNPLVDIQQLVNWLKDTVGGGAEVRKHKVTITRVEQERGIPRGYLGAIIWHEGSAWHKGPDKWLARLGRDTTTIGLAEVSVRTAQGLEEKGYMPASKNYTERVDRLLDPKQNIEYAGAYLQLLYEWVNEEAPLGTMEQVKWDLAVVGYNIGEGGLEESFKAYGFGGLGPRGQKYYHQVIPHIPKVVAWLYGD
jgi:hypothetical protein